jgi:glycosyltransferase involved in cell wall biosynthesis
VNTSVLIANWRDTLHPEGGGSERYVERVAAGLVSRGCRVTIVCARHDNAPRESVVDGLRFHRRGNKFTVYLWALLTAVLTRPDVVIDVQNGMPFFTRLVTRRPVIVLVHHLHREQWVWTFGQTLGKVGWWLESWLAPRVYRRSRYVTVSEHTRDELVALGVDRERITLVPNGLDPVPAVDTPPTEEPTLVALSRLVPHKRLEHAIDTVARLSDRWPALRLDIIGRGPWLDPLVEYARQRDALDRVRFLGWVSDTEKHEILARSWVHLCPSVKEGWGIAVMEAAWQGVPTVAYRSAGGVCESVLDNQTGLLADDLDEFVSNVDRIVRCSDVRQRMSVESRAHARRYEWERSVETFAAVVRHAVGGLEQAVQQGHPVASAGAPSAQR